MNVDLNNFLFFSTLPMELFVSLLLYCDPLHHRKHYFFRIAAVLSIFLVSAWIFVHIVSACAFAHTITQGKSLAGEMTGWAWNSYFNRLIYSFASYLLAMALDFFLCAVSLSESIYCATCAYLTQHLTYCVFRLMIPGMVEGDISTYTVWYFVIYGISYWGASQLISRPLAIDGGYHTGLSRSLLLTVSALAVALVLSAVGQELQGENIWLDRLGVLYGTFCCFFALWGQVSEQRQLRLQYELSLQKQLWIKHKAQYELSAQSSKLISYKCHDLKHQIAALKTISDQTQRDRSIQELEKSVAIYDSIVKTGNSILDTVLTEKSLLCEAKKINLICSADGACLSFMDVVDLYTIFGNALDNAIECVSQLESPGKRTIDLQVFSSAGIVLIVTENCCDGDLRFNDGLPVTSKAEEQGYHGFGLKSVRYVAEKYGGFLTIRQGGCVFQLRVTIPQY